MEFSAYKFSQINLKVFKVLLVNKRALGHNIKIGRVNFIFYC